MLEEFSVGRNTVITNFSIKYCVDPNQLLSSNGFNRILNLFIKKISNDDIEIYKYFSSISNNIASDITKLFKLLMVFDIETIINTNEEYKLFFDRKDLLIEFLEDLYNFWRNFERYAVIVNKNTEKGLQKVNFFDSMDKFTNLILFTYRKIEETLLGIDNRVYRQLSAGVNLGLTVSKVNWVMPSEYKNLQNINFINSIILHPPFIVNPTQSKRKGIFEEIFENPLDNVRFDENDWLCYPLKVGTLLAFVYFHKDFMAQGVSLSNLFEMADKTEYENKKPDIIFTYGVKDDSPTIKYPFYYDKKNDIIVGYINNVDEIDYFGYVKKMILTLHNVRMIEKGCLPIHGAMVNIVFKNGVQKNIVIMGDSGVGKSESLEAFRILSEDYVKEMKTIFDDMGYLDVKDGKILGYGTETGAFVRLDDLDRGYSLKVMDRSIFMKCETNSRVIIPISTYNTITKGFPIDYFFYANNYEDGEELEFFDNLESAKEIFVSGARMAKGTTSEKGLVMSYFANPFGPVQKRKETDVLIDKFFNKMFKDKIIVGQLRTRLGIKGCEQSGPLKAAKKLFDLFVK